MKPPASISFVLVQASVFSSVLLPNITIARMRGHWSWFGRQMLLIERMHSALNLMHAALLVLTDVTLHVAFSGWRLARTTILLAFGIVSGIVQLFTPEPHPRISDALIDLPGGMLDWVAMRILTGRP